METLEVKKLNELFLSINILINNPISRKYEDGEITYIVKYDEENFIKLVFSEDSYQESEIIQSIQFVKPVKKEYIEYVTI
jgi:hypothetical protein